MKAILVVGAGRSATSLIDFLTRETAVLGWSLSVADGNLALAASKTGSARHVKAIGLNVEDEQDCLTEVQKADLVISLLPPHLHVHLAKACLKAKKHFLTASYVDPGIRAYEKEIASQKLLFLYEMGLDPGIDHMSALKMIEEIRAEGGQIISFRSHCGGLVAPESDNNPWHYKISWNTRNIVQAGKAGARFRQNGQITDIGYEDLFDPNRIVAIPELGNYAWYPNRDSLPYAELYALKDIPTFIRTTLRHPEFCFGWKNIIDLKLTDETLMYPTDGMTLKDFFRKHFARNGFSAWLDKQVTERFAQTKVLLQKLQELLQVEGEVDESHRDQIKDFMMVDQEGALKDINLESVKAQAAATVAEQMHEANLALKQLIFLGMDDDQTVINKGSCSALDVLQFCLEKKLLLQPGDKDMIVMFHELSYTKSSQTFHRNSSLVVKGQDALHTAMAKTVGLPLGIAALLILQGKIKLTGLQIPVHREIYEPVLATLAQQGIAFTES